MSGCSIKNSCSRTKNTGSVSSRMNKKIQHWSFMKCFLIQHFSIMCITELIVHIFAFFFFNQEIDNGVTDQRIGNSFNL